MKCPIIVNNTWTTLSSCMSLNSIVWTIFHNQSPSSLRRLSLLVLQIRPYTDTKGWVVNTLLNVGFSALIIDSRVRVPTYEVFVLLSEIATLAWKGARPPTLGLSVNVHISTTKRRVSDLWLQSYSILPKPRVCCFISHWMEGSFEFPPSS